MKIELMFCEEMILQEIADIDSTRNDVAITYAFCTDSCEKVNFAKINNAIIERWSNNALLYIKTKAREIGRGRI